MLKHSPIETQKYLLTTFNCKMEYCFQEKKKGKERLECHNFKASLVYIEISRKARAISGDIEKW